MKTIKSELGEGFDDSGDIEEYRRKIERLNLPEQVSEKLKKELSRLSKQPFGSAESSVIRNYLDTCIELPWSKTTKEEASVEAARKILDEEHYGLEKVKDRIIEFIAVKQLSPGLKGTILCLVGPPGTGKTSIAMSVARALNRKLARISLGGIHDEAEIRGHRKTYVGAMPGRIINAMIHAGTKNPLLLLDEIDKLGRDYRGDPSAALLETLDSEQNNNFRDHYLEVPFDLSDVLFITTANTTETISRPLLDRMEVIELTSYTDEEKLQIAKRHLFPKQRKKHGVKATQLKVSDDAFREIISRYTRESGVRILEREIAELCRKAAVKLVDKEAKSFNITSAKLEEFLGVAKYKPEARTKKNEVGLAQGLAWTRVGGDLLNVEAAVMDGNGRLELTGNLGEVMKESARAAETYIRSRASVLGIDPEFYKKKDIHLHFPEGAVPKDGPSAGITIATALISALTGRAVRSDIAMTGEITLRGRILPIGGLKEKTMAAFRYGIKTVVIPFENEPDLKEIDQTVRNSLNFIASDHIDNIIDVVLEKPLNSESKIEISEELSAPAEGIKNPIEISLQ
jgi:ATP-dependent Lon protease